MSMTFQMALQFLKPAISGAKTRALTQFVREQLGRTGWKTRNFWGVFTSKN